MGGKSPRETGDKTPRVILSVVDPPRNERFERFLLGIREKLRSKILERIVYLRL